MKHINHMHFIVAMATAVCALIPAHAMAGRRGGDKNAESVRIVVVGLHHNVGSNYFSHAMIIEDTGISADSIDVAYNEMITDHIVALTEGERCQFVAPEEGTDMVDDLIAHVVVRGETDEEQYADLSQVDAADIARLLQATDADYVLLLSQHYLKWQEKPLRTLFHITSYSLHDATGRTLLHHSDYFTTMDLEPRARLTRDSRKCSSKIVAYVSKSLPKALALH